MKLDILVIAAHPDDAELSCGGTLAKHTDLGYAVGIIDLTEGELGTRGTVETRYDEAETAARILGVNMRENLQFRDGWFKDDEEHRLKIIEKIRKFKPEIVITNALRDRHPDHARASNLVVEATWLAGLSKIETIYDGKIQEPWRPKHVYRFLQYDMIEPDFVVDISGYELIKMEAILAYRTQFYNPDAEASNTFISKPEFIDLLNAKIMMAGNYAHIDKAEAFTSAYKPAIKNLFDLI